MIKKVEIETEETIGKKFGKKSEVGQLHLLSINFTVLTNSNGIAINIGQKIKKVFEVQKENLNHLRLDRTGNVNSQRALKSLSPFNSDDRRSRNLRLFPKKFITITDIHF